MQSFIAVINKHTAKLHHVGSLYILYRIGIIKLGTNNIMCRHNNRWQKYLDLNFFSRLGVQREIFTINIYCAVRIAI